MFDVREMAKKIAHDIVADPGNRTLRLILADLAEDADVEGNHGVRIKSLRSKSGWWEISWSRYWNDVDWAWGLSWQPICKQGKGKHCHTTPVTPPGYCYLKHSSVPCRWTQKDNDVRLVARHGTGWKWVCELCYAMTFKKYHKCQIPF